MARLDPGGDNHRMEQHLHDLDELAARLQQRLAADPNHPNAARMRADLARLEAWTTMDGKKDARDGQGVWGEPSRARRERGTALGKKGDEK